MLCSGCVFFSDLTHHCFLSGLSLPFVFTTMYFYAQNVFILLHVVFRYNVWIFRTYMSSLVLNPLKSSMFSAKSTITNFWVLTLHSIAFINSKGLLLRFYVTWQELGYIYCPIYYSRWLFFLVLMVIWVLLPNFFSSVIYLMLWLALAKCVFQIFVFFFSPKPVQAWPGDYVTSGFTASYT